MPRRPSCLCGACPKCDKRAYDHEYRDRTIEQRRDYQLSYRAGNLARLTQAKRERAAKRKAFIDSHRAGGCRLCDFDVAQVCQFHHVDPAQKEAEVATLTASSESRILREIEKCIVLCPNCHALVHAGLIDLEAVTW
jgi:predicted HNH restriction endonuclease